ncbi:MAG: hypothetical protein EOO88_47130 [Pedobacter sp.]|nr:MAG: hypothetical protein EOO88_47130 [Pedobacter sp.]
MGNEFGQTSEWNYKSELNWSLLQFDGHSKLKTCVTDLNKLLTSEPAMHEYQFAPEGFEWGQLHHRSESIISYFRKGKKTEDDLLIVLNMTPVVRNDWSIEVRGKTYQREIFNSNDIKYWGTGDVYNPDIRSEVVDKEHKISRITLNLPPLSAIVIK